MEHLRQSAAAAGIKLPSQQEVVSEIDILQPEFPIPRLTLVDGNITVNSGNKEDRKVNKESLLGSSH